METPVKVFVMWSGERSKLLGAELKSFLEVVVRGPEYFMSTSGIASGQNWNVVLSTELRTTHVGIACLVPENLNSLWIHFEAGALSKACDGARVIPYLLDVENTQVVGPLTQFQMRTATKESTQELARDLCTAQFGDDRRAREIVDVVFGDRWKTFHNKLTNIRERPPEEKVQPVRTDTELIREILETVRGFDTGIHAITNELGEAKLIMRAAQWMVNRYAALGHSDAAIGDLQEFAYNIPGWDAMSEEDRESALLARSILRSADAAKGEESEFLKEQTSANRTETKCEDN